MKKLLYILLVLVLYQCSTIKHKESMATAELEEETSSDSLSYHFGDQCYVSEKVYHQLPCDNPSYARIRGCYNLVTYMNLCVRE